MPKVKAQENCGNRFQEDGQWEGGGEKPLQKGTAWDAEGDGGLFRVTKKDLKYRSG